MNVFLWIITWVLAVLFAASGAGKLAQSKEKLIASGMGWAEDFSGGAIKAIGGLEIVAAIGLVVPALGIAPVLTPLAATGLALLMAAAMAIHLRRHDPARGVVVTLALLVLSGFVAWGRFF